MNPIYLCGGERHAFAIELKQAAEVDEEALCGLGAEVANGSSLWTDVRLLIETKMK
jgi:hypothetical protein